MYTPLYCSLLFKMQPGSYYIHSSVLLSPLSQKKIGSTEHLCLQNNCMDTSVHIALLNSNVYSLVYNKMSLKNWYTLWLVTFSNCYIRYYLHAYFWHAASNVYIIVFVMVHSISYGAVIINTGPVSIYIMTRQLGVLILRLPGDIESYLC